MGTLKDEPIQRRIAKRCQGMNRISAANYRKVIVALYLTSHNDSRSNGVINTATNIEIGEAAGLTGQSVTRYLEYAEADRVTRTFRKGLICRVIVLLDGPNARTWVKNLEYQSSEISRARHAVGA